MARTYPDETPGTHSRIGYAAAQLVVEGLRRAGTELTRDRFISALEGLTERTGGLLPPISYGPADHRGLTTLALLRARGGRWILERGSLKLAIGRKEWRRWKPSWRGTGCSASGRIPVEQAKIDSGAPRRGLGSRPCSMSSWSRAWWVVADPALTRQISRYLVEVQEARVFNEFMDMPDSCTERMMGLYEGLEQTPCFVFICLSPRRFSHAEA